jgi:hypothetical protein
VSKTKPPSTTTPAGSAASAAEAEQASALAWPMEGGCWIRQADGSLVRDSTGDAPAADSGATDQPADQPAQQE